MNLERYDLEGLLNMLMITKKKELVKYCRSLVIYGAAFANIISGAEAGLLGYFHRIYHRDFQDEGLHLKRKDTDATRCERAWSSSERRCPKGD